MNRYGPSRRRAQNASAALRIFVRYPEKTFATISEGERKTWADRQDEANDGVDDARSRHRMCQRGIVEQRITGGGVHMQGSTSGVDLATNVFQVHGVDGAGKV